MHNPPRPCVGEDAMGSLMACMGRDTRIQGGDEEKYRVDQRDQDQVINSKEEDDDHCTL